MLISYLYFYLKFHRKSLHRLLLCLHLTSAVSLLLPYIVGRPWINWQLEFCYPFGGWSGWCSGSNSLKKKDIKMPFILFALLNAASFGLHSIKSFSALIFYADKKNVYIHITNFLEILLHNVDANKHESVFWDLERWKIMFWKTKIMLEKFVVQENKSID